MDALIEVLQFNKPHTAKNACIPSSIGRIEAERRSEFSIPQRWRAGLAGDFRKVPGIFNAATDSRFFSQIGGRN